MTRTGGRGNGRGSRVGAFVVVCGLDGWGKRTRPGPTWSGRRTKRLGRGGGGGRGATRWAAPPRPRRGGLARTPEPRRDRSKHAEGPDLEVPGLGHAGQLGVIPAGADARENVRGATGVGEGVGADLFPVDARDTPRTGAGAQQSTRTGEAGAPQD